MKKGLHSDALRGRLAKLEGDLHKVQGQLAKVRLSLR